MGSRGAKHTTTAISTTPMLTSTVRVGAPNAIDDTHCQEANKGNYASGFQNNGFEGCYKVVYFTPDLPEGELAVGDHIRVGQDIRHVHTLTRNSLTGGYLSATVSFEFSSTFGAGSYAYRQSATAAVKAALENLPGNVCGAITATRSLSGGSLVFAPDTSNAAATTAISSGATQFSAGLAREGVMVGDIIRLHSNVGQMQVTSIALTAASGAIASMDGSADAFVSSSDNGVASGANAKIVIRENGFSYKVQFDGTSGDVADLVCDSSNLRPVYRMGVAGYVTRDEPDRIYFVDVTQGSSQPVYKQVTVADRSHPSAVAAGDIVYIGEQRCEVVSTDDEATGTLAEPYLGLQYQANSVVCKDALTANSHSTANELYTHEPLEVFLGHETVSCASTDTPPLRFAREKVTASQDALCANGEACVDVWDYNGELRMVAQASIVDGPSSDDPPVQQVNRPTSSDAQENTLLDLGDLAVGDRVMIDTLGHTQEIRTVDSIHIGQATGATQNNYFTVSQPFSEEHGNKDIYLYWKGSTGSATCSGRGICDEGTGDCQCFRGYTGQACQVQNALAA